MKSLTDAWQALITASPANEIRELTDEFYATLQACFAKLDTAGTQGRYPTMISGADTPPPWLHLR